MAKELVKVEDYALASQGKRAAEILAAATGGQPIQPMDLDQIRIPAAGAVNWEVPELGDTVAQPELRGIIVHWREERAYWVKDYDESGGGEPDCIARDAQRGIGNPGGDCSKCPMAEYGSANKGNGQACQLRRLIFMIRKDDFLPAVVNVSPGSIKGLHKYFLSLASRGMFPHQVETSLTLEARMSKTNVKYSSVVAKATRALDGPTLKAVEAYVDEIKGTMITPERKEPEKKEPQPEPAAATAGGDDDGAPF